MEKKEETTPQSLQLNFTRKSLVEVSFSKSDILIALEGKMHLLYKGTFEVPKTLNAKNLQILAKYVYVYCKADTLEETRSNIEKYLFDKYSVSSYTILLGIYVFIDMFNESTSLPDEVKEEDIDKLLDLHFLPF